jgi:O-Antigen ligase
VSADELVTWFAVGGSVGALLVVISLATSARTVFAFLIGATGVLMQAQIGGAHAFTIVTFAWLVVAGRRKGAERAARTGLLLAAAGLLAFTAIFGDLVNSRTLAVQLLALSASAGALAVWATSADVRLILRAALLTITAGAAVGLLQVLHVIPVSQDLWSAEVSQIGRPVGIWPEPDWLGLFSALGLVLAWRLVLSPLVRTVALTLNGLAFLLAFARAAWLALLVSIVLVAVIRFVTSARREGIGGRGAPLVVLLMVACVVLVANPTISSDVGRRVESLVSTSSDDVSAKARVQQTNGLLTLGQTAFPFGHGLSASGRVGVSGRLYIGITPQENNNVGSNWILAMWVDGALLAIPLVLFVLLIAIRGARLLPGQLLVIVLFSSLWSNAFFLPVTWLCLGLIMRELPARGRPALHELATRLPEGLRGTVHATRKRAERLAMTGR